MSRNFEIGTPAQQAENIARAVLAGKCDPLLACRDLFDLRASLELFPTTIMDTIAGVASEVDGLPIGSERSYWAPEALKVKDAEVETYRRRVRNIINKAMQGILDFSRSASGLQEE